MLYVGLLEKKSKFACQFNQLNNEIHNIQWHFSLISRVVLLVSWLGFVRCLFFILFLPRASNLDNVIVSGRDLVTWLLGHVEGLSSRREASTYAAGMLKAGYIRHTVNKSSFSEKCYYVFSDVVRGLLVCCVLNFFALSYYSPVVLLIFMYSASKYDCIAPLLTQLHWLKAPEWIEFKLTILVYRYLWCTALSYLTGEFQQSSAVEAHHHLSST